MFASTSDVCKLSTGISIIDFPPSQKILLAGAQCNGESSLQCKVPSWATEGAIGASRENPQGRNRPSFDPRLRHFAALLPFSSLKSDPVVSSLTRLAPAEPQSALPCFQTGAA